MSSFWNRRMVLIRKRKWGERMEIMICITCSIAVSVITTKILATHYFEIVNGYVKDICDETKEFVETVGSMIRKY